MRARGGVATNDRVGAKPLTNPRTGVVIVGGGPAGLSTALFLAHHRPDLRDHITVFERERYPRDKYCAGAIGARADELLASIGVRVDVPSVPIHGMSAAFQAGAITLREPGIGRVIRRIEFDHALALAARARGLSVLEGVGVTSIAWDPEGALLQTSEGPVRARVVVGADGVGSVVRRAMGLPFGRIRAQVAEVDTEPVSQDDPSREILHFDLSLRDFAGYSWDFPTLVDGKELVCRGAYVLCPPDATADVKEILRARLKRLGLDLDRYRLKRFSERGFESSQPISRPGAILAGEAAGIDPMLGEGIPQAIDYGALAGLYLAEKLPPPSASAGAQKSVLAFDDWTARVSASRLGQDLRIRSAFLTRYYFRSSLRDPIERFVLTGPAFVRAGLRYFGGKPIPRRDRLAALASAALFAPALGARAIVREAARAALARAFRAR